MLMHSCAMYCTICVPVSKLARYFSCLLFTFTFMFCHNGGMFDTQSMNTRIRSGQFTHNPHERAHADTCTSVPLYLIIFMHCTNRGRAPYPHRLHPQKGRSPWSPLVSTYSS